MVKSISKAQGGEEISDDTELVSKFTTKSDCFVEVDVQIDASKTVNPITSPIVQVEESKEITIDQELRAFKKKIINLPKYSYYESSNNKWVKCLVTIEGINEHPKDKIEVRFTERTVDLIVHDWNNSTEILHFGVRKLHCKTQPTLCKWALKSDGIQHTFRKFKENDNWWSFFK